MSALRWRLKVFPGKIQHVPLDPIYTLQNRALPEQRRSIPYSRTPTINQKANNRPTKPHITRTKSKNRSVIFSAKYTHATRNKRKINQRKYIRVCTMMRKPHSGCRRQCRTEPVDMAPEPREFGRKPSSPILLPVPHDKGTVPSMLPSRENE